MTTSPKVAKKAAKLLPKKGESKEHKSVDASALEQAKTKKKTKR
jgi:hypothetical protein